MDAIGGQESGQRWGNMRITSGGGRGMGTVGRLVGTLVFAAAVALITGYFAARTQGGKTFLTEWAAKRVGLDLQVGHTRVGWPYELVFEDVASVEKAASGQPLLAAREVRVGWAPCRGWRVYARRAETVLGETAGGAWKPAFLAPLGRLDPTNLHALSAASAEFRGRVSLELDDAAVEWLGGGGADYTCAQGIDFRLAPVRLPNRRMYHSRLSAQSLVKTDGTALNGVKLEWLSADGMEDVEIRCAATAPQAGAPSTGTSTQADEKKAEKVDEVKQEGDAERTEEVGKAGAT